MYIYIYNVYVLCEWFKGSPRRSGVVSQKKGGREKTLVCLVPPPLCSFRAAIVVAHNFRGSGGVGCPGFAWALGATARRAEPQPPAPPAVFKQRR